MNYQIFLSDADVLFKIIQRRRNAAVDQQNSPRQWIPSPGAFRIA